MVHLDNASNRVSYKFIRKMGPEPVFEMTSAAFPSEARQMQSLTEVAQRVITATSLLPDFFVWRSFVRGNDASVRDGIFQLQLLERLLDPIPDRPYPPGQGDLLFMHGYGRGHDMLLMGTWDMLHVRREYVRDSSLAQSVKDFADLDSEAVRAQLPPEPTGKVRELSAAVLLHLERIVRQSSG